jgi:hypothetical protein
MSPTSCHCSTPRCWERAGRSVGSGVPDLCARRPRLPRGRPRSTLRRWRRARPGSGWDGVVRRRSRPRAQVKDPPIGIPSFGSTVTRLRTIPESSTICGALTDRSRGPSPAHAAHGIPPESGADVAALKRTPPSTMSTASLRSVARRPRAASQPGRLPGVLPLSSEKVHLGAGFPLRCCQRLSLPNVATQHCR